MARLNVRDFGTALSFDGASYVSVDALATGTFGGNLNGNFTVSAYAKTNQSPTQEVWSFGNDTTTTPYALLDINNSAGRARFSIRNDANSTDSATATTSKITVGPEWHHYVCVKTDTQILLYIDGLVAATDSSLAGGIYTLNKFTIGALTRTTTTNFINGLIDSVLVWKDRALTAAEVSELYYNGLTRGSTLATGLVGEWLFNEGSGSTAYDTSGNGNHGTITGATYTTDVPMVARGGVPTGGDPALMRKFVNGNLIKNGDFKYTPPFTAATTTSGRWIDGTAAGSTTNSSFGWAILSGAVVGSYAAMFDTTNTYNGKPTLKVSTTAPGSTAEVANLKATSDLKLNGISVRQNTTYTLSYKMKTDKISGASAIGAYVKCVERDANNGNNVTNAITPIATSTGWTDYSITFTTANTTRFVMVRPAVEDTAGTLIMDAWFADIKLTPLFPEQRTLINGNLIRNGDFKYTPPFTAATTSANSWIDGVAGGSSTNDTFGWWLFRVSNTMEAKYDTATTYNSLPTLKLSCINTAGRGLVRQYSSTNTTPPSTTRKYMIPVLPNTEYIFSGFVKTANVATNAVYISAKEVDGAMGSVTATNDTTKLSGTNDWTKLSTTFTTQATTRYITVELLNNVAGNVSDAWFADIQLKPTTHQTRQTA